MTVRNAERQTLSRLSYRSGNCLACGAGSAAIESPPAKYAQPMPGRSYAAAIDDPEPVHVLRWAEFQRFFLNTHEQGEHVAIVGPTGGGKTRIGLELCKLVGSRMASDRRPSRVTVLCYKPRDDTIREVLPEREWPVIKSWPPGYGQEHCIVWVRGGKTNLGRRKLQRAVFVPLLDQMYAEGHQSVYIPEAAHFERPLNKDGLGMSGTMTELWSAARSNKLTVISDTQRPRWVSVSMWTEPTFFVIVKPKHRADIKTIAEASGFGFEVWEAVSRLGPYEFVCVVTKRGGVEGIFVSKVGV